MTRTRILVVEDTPDLALAVSMELEELGFEVALAHTGAEGLDEVAKEPPDLAVLDMQLPDTTGIALCEEIRKSHTLPVIIFSGVNSQASVVEVIQRGATDYVLKGSGLDELVARVKQHLGMGESPAGEAAAGQPNTDAVTAVEEPDDGRQRVMVVEADRETQAKLVEALTSAGYRVATASSSSEAKELAGRQPPSAAFIALDSPKIGGIKLIQELAAIGGIGLVGVSKRMSPEATRRAKYHGVTSFIQRPWNASRIYLELQHAIDTAVKAAKRAA